MGKSAVNTFFRKKVTGRKKMGRPTLKPEDRRSFRLEITLRPREAKALAALAKSNGKTFKSWAREVLLATAGAK
ncbi:MAG TPA: hypothetical protein VG013_17265 [Gemmataceae bacterium]|jgi:hypothetical protein|nr:hypothetical protein [Gemmataceae bacterium]